MTVKKTNYHGMPRIMVLMRKYWEGRFEKRELPYLNSVIRDLRVLLQEVLSDHFMGLTLEEAKDFRSSLSDHLNGLSNEFNSKCNEEERAHNRYCVQEILSCFEWAEQIKEDLPDDPVTQKVLSVDIPILRPFDYGFKLTKSSR